MAFIDSDGSNSRQFSNVGEEDSNSRGVEFTNAYSFGDESNSNPFQVPPPDQNMEENANAATTKRKLDQIEGDSSSDQPLIGNGRSIAGGGGGVEDGTMNPAGDDEERMDTDGPSPNKKPFLQVNIRKLLPDLERLWKAVEEEPSDFTAWTQLLQYVDSENELLAAREAYDAFLQRYPYCYGYWKKYADYEKRKGSVVECAKVFNRGLKAISLSVDLWIHYLNYVKATHETDLEAVRAQFEVAITACGMEFRSDKLWEHYIQWERENNNYVNVLNIYDRVLSTPTQNYQIHLQNIKEFVNQYKPSEILSNSEFTELKNAVEVAFLATAETQPGEPMDEETEMNKMRELIVERRTELYKKNELEIIARWTFEEAIKRPYFHVKPLEKGQLKMWKEYLEFEIRKGDARRITILFERCLIACALYEEYWIKYVRYLMNQNENGSLTSEIEDVFTRACTIHHPNKPWINLYWAAYQESHGNFDAAVAILERLDSATPTSLVVAYRHINLERRRGNLVGCSDLFKKYIEEMRVKNPANSVHLSLKYARFLNKTLGDYEAAKQILQNSMDVDPTTRARCIMALVEIGMERTPIDDTLILSTFDAALTGSLPEEQKVTFAHRKIEFLEDYGMDVESVNKAQDELQKLAKIMREKQATTTSGGGATNNNGPTTGGENKVDGGQSGDGSKASGGDTAAATTNGGAAGAYDQYAYSQQYNQYGNYANWTPYGQGGQQGWNAYQGYYGASDSTTGA